MNAPSLASAPLVWILGLVAAQRLIELTVARRNTAMLLARGATEVGAAHYPLFLALHASWLTAIALTTPWDRTPYWGLIAIFAGLQLLRIWVVSTLGPYWTTRIITLDTAPLVRRGPFRLVRHPNYCIVCAEIALLPLAFGNWPVALVWSGLNALLLQHRIRIEAQALRAREST